MVYAMNRRSEATDHVLNCRVCRKSFKQFSLPRVHIMRLFSVMQFLEFVQENRVPYLGDCDMIFTQDLSPLLFKVDFSGFGIER